MKYVIRFADLKITDVPRVGGKNASLGEMYSSLIPMGIEVPDGFATTAEAYWHYIDHNGLRERIFAELDGLDIQDTQALARVGQNIRAMIEGGTMPEDLAAEIAQAYQDLCAKYGGEDDMAVRSSATAEDLPNASFAGQQETYLNIRGVDNLLATCRKVFASLFTNRAIAYRVHQGFAHQQVALSIGVQKMVRSDVGASGVMFTLDTESGFRDVVFITAAWGLGENVVQGAVNPDEFVVFKPTLRDDLRPILKRKLGEKAIRMVYTDSGLAGASTVNVPVPPDARARFALSDDEVLELARQAAAIEKHYTERAGEPRPMDIEWAKDGVNGRLFIVQARPETVQSRANAMQQVVYTLHERGPVLASGRAVGGKIAQGRARVILKARDMHSLKPGEVLVTDITDPDWEPVMKLASAIVTNRGGRTCHAAIIARELGIPAVVGCGDATRRLSTGTEVTVSCAEGDTGYVYAGKRAFTRKEIDLSHLPQPKTKLMLNVANPDQVFELSPLPAAGVGLARLEFIINHSIRVHPRALLELDRQDAALQQTIREIIAGYPDPREFYIQRLAEGIGTIAAAFYPRPVIVRFSDFKSNEYRSLIGGEQYEPEEENPMLGLRGAARYYSESFSDCFAMECEAMRRVRDDMGLTNAAVMLPFVRSVEEMLGVMDIMKGHGLSRGVNDLKVYLMCEIPANVILADDFLAHVDGFSIGSNDLTQLTLGVDRDSGLLQGFDERHPAVTVMMRQAIEACHRHGKYVGICGQAPSDFPEITRFLVEQGIESLSLNPDSLIGMLQVVLEEEKRH
ncbi:MAG: phosphoenolpyruvate synthase [Halothiobacillaceae bacterium]|nr:phosphoenolpyruvate synthase [Halothiobacillaceae bacterium]